MFPGQAPCGLPKGASGRSSNRATPDNRVCHFRPKSANFPRGPPQNQLPPGRFRPRALAGRQNRMVVEGGRGSGRREPIPPRPPTPGHVRGGAPPTAQAETPADWPPGHGPDAPPPDFPASSGRAADAVPVGARSSGEVRPFSLHHVATKHPVQLFLQVPGAR